MFSLKVIAEQLQVSTATVSNALNNKGKISPALRRKIIELARKNGYKISPHALALQGKRLSILGLMIPSIEDDMAQNFFLGADRAAQERDYSTILAVTSHPGTNRGEVELRSVSRFDLLRIGGVLYVPAADTEHLKVERLMAKRGLPFVLLYRRRTSDKSPAVVVDHAAGFRLGLEHLLSLGHSRIGVVYDPYYTGPELDIARQVFQDRFPSFPWETWSAPAIWQNLHMLIKNRATAMLALSDDMAYTITDLLKDHGYSVPEDISVVGFRDTIVARRMSPKMTTIHVPAEEMGYAAARWLVANIENVNSRTRGADPSPIDLCIPPQLVVRQSTAPPSRRKAK